MMTSTTPTLQSSPRMSLSTSTRRRIQRRSGKSLSTPGEASKDVNPGTLTIDSCLVGRRRRSQAKSFDSGDCWDSDYSFSDDSSDLENIPNKTDEYDHPAQKIYKAACRRCKQVVSSVAVSQIHTKELILVNQCLGPRAMKPLCMALVGNVTVAHLDLGANGIEAEGAKYLADVLQENIYIIELNLSENNLRGAGAKAITRPLITRNRTLAILNLSGNGFEESDAVHFARLLKANRSLKELSLSHNAFRERGGELLAPALVENTGLKSLDLSWNHLRLIGAVSICKGLQENHGLLDVNLSWNGFGPEVCIELERTLTRNRKLQRLDLSANRIDAKALAYLLRGLGKNRSLQMLNIGSNPFYSDAATSILHWYQQTPNSGLKTIVLSNISINTEFVETLHTIQRRSSLVVIHDSVTNCGRRALTKKLSVFDVPTDPLMVLFEYMKQSNLRLVDFFHVLDKDKSDTITMEEFRDGLQGINIPLSERALNNLMKRLDVNKDGEIDYGEFVIAHRDNNRKVGTITSSHDPQRTYDFEQLREKVRQFARRRNLSAGVQGGAGGGDEAKPAGATRRAPTM